MKQYEKLMQDFKKLAMEIILFKFNRYM